MNVLIVLGYGHPGHGMGDEPKGVAKWNAYIRTIVDCIETYTIDVVCLTGGPIYEGQSEAQAMYNSLSHYTLNVKMFLEEESLITFENFKFSKRRLKEKGIEEENITTLIVLGAAHKEISFHFLELVFFPFILSKGVETYPLIPTRQRGKDIITMLVNASYLIPGIGKYMLRSNVKARSNLLRKEGKRLPATRTI